MSTDANNVNTHASHSSDPTHRTGGETTIRTDELPAAIAAAGGPITIMVPDFTDPTGMRKIPRAVDAAYAADIPGETVGRWQIYFTDTTFPMILITAGSHAYQVVAS